MVTKIKGTEGIQFPDASTQGTAADAGPAFSAKRTTIQTVVTGTDTIVVFPTEVFDTNGSYNPANGRFQPNVAGYYQVNASAVTNSDNTMTSASMTLLKNSAENVGSNSQFVNGLFGSRMINNLVYMNGTTDYLEVVVNLVGTGPLYIDGANTRPAFFSAFLARRAAP